MPHLVDHQLISLVSHPYGLVCILVGQCSKCLEIFRLHTSEMVSYDDQNHYATNVGAVLGQMATSGGAAQLEEQLSCVSVPSLTNATMKHTLGTYLKSLITE